MTLTKCIRSILYWDDLSSTILKYPRNYAFDRTQRYQFRQSKVTNSDMNSIIPNKTICNTRIALDEYEPARSHSPLQLKIITSKIIPKIRSKFKKS